MAKTKGKLKPCPFCGGEASIATVKYSPCDITKLNNREKGYFVNCQICSARNEFGISYATEEEAIKHWNTRVSHDDLRAALKEIREWRMYSGTSAYKDCEQNEHYSHAYYLMEKEIAKARQLARIALAKAGGK